MEKRTRFQKIHLCVLAAMILIFGAITVFNQYHRGFRFQNGLLKPSMLEDGTIVYSGKVNGGLVTAAVTHPTNFLSVVDLQIGEILHDVCEIEYPLEKMSTTWEGADNVYRIRMTKNDALLFEGGLSMDYLDGSGSIGWFDKYGEWSLENVGIVSLGVPYNWEDYETSPALFARFALYPELTARGNLGFYAILVLFTLFTMAMVAFPRDFFDLRYQRFVKNAEPSDYYINSMRWSTVFVTIVLFVGFCWASCTLPN
ncbi:MAG: hypothetical protein HFF84_07465 [Oscillibacter sp.]|nr:hypothetical protein [Oscillibacter sp.]